MTSGPRERKLSGRRKRAREVAGPIKADEAGGGRSDRGRAAAAAPGKLGRRHRGLCMLLTGTGGGPDPGGELLAAPPRHRRPAAETARAALSRCS